MCRFVAVAADRPVDLGPLLVSGPHALARQSNRDRRGVCHDSGWGLGYFAGGRPERVRSTLAAWHDPLFADAVAGVRPRVAVAHVRLATIGRVAERNCHPFEHGGWLFAHNGTLVGFAAEPDPLVRLIPPEFRGGLDGETDSEHVFRLLAGRIPARPAAADVAAVVRRTVAELAALYPGSDADPTRLNVVLTDGRVLAAARWGHWLFRLDQRGDGPVPAADGGGPARAVALASEPPTDDAGWAEVQDRSVLVVDDGLEADVLPIGG